MDEFLAACAAPERLRLTVEIAGGQMECALRQPFAIVGRDPRADIHIPDERLRSFHVYLQFINGRLAFVDLNHELPPFRGGWLDPGQRVEFGRLAIRAPDDLLVSGSNGPGQSETDSRGNLNQILFDVSSRNVRTTWRMKRPVALVGKSPICRIRLAGEQVSRIHCALVNTPVGLWAVDLKSTNGIAINGTPRPFGVLPNGSQLQVCKFVISPRAPAQTSPNPGMLPIRVLPVTDPSAPADSATSISVQPQPSDSGFFPAPLTIASSESPARLSEAEMAPIVLQLSKMQQQAFGQMQKLMAEQFQQSMSMFVDAFWAMQQEQSKQVRRELRQIRRLTRELTSLQTQITQLQVTGVSGPARTEDSVPQPQRIVEPAIPPAPNPSPSKTKTVIEKPQTDRTASPASKSPSRPIRQSPADMHAWLNHRVARIQQKRQTSWQRLMSLLQGKSVPSGDPASSEPSEPSM